MVQLPVEKERKEGGDKSGGRREGGTGSAIAEGVSQPWQWLLWKSRVPADHGKHHPLPAAPGFKSLLATFSCQPNAVFPPGGGGRSVNVSACLYCHVNANHTTGGGG